MLRACSRVATQQLYRTKRCTHPLANTTFLFSNDMTTSSPAVVVFPLPLRAVLRRDEGAGEAAAPGRRGPPVATGPGVAAALPGESALPSMALLCYWKGVGCARCVLSFAWVLRLRRQSL